MGLPEVVVFAQLTSDELALVQDLAGESWQNGDIIYYNNGWQRLGAGTNGHILTVASGLPSWSAAGASYTNEQAQDAVGSILTDSDTIDFTYDDGANTITAVVRTQMSITSDTSGVKLSGDSASPGNSKYYGTDGSGTKGWHSFPAGGAVAFADITGDPSDNAALDVALDAKQPLDATLTALAAYNTDGVLVQTAANTFVGRAITGTANKITVTNGNGVAGNPTLTIPDDVVLVTPAIGVATGTSLALTATSGIPLTSKSTQDAASIQALVLEGDRATVATNDEVYMSFKLSDDAGNQDEVARIAARLTTVTSGAEVSRLIFSVRTGGTITEELLLTGSTFAPVANDGNTLGSGTLSWADLFLASGGVINWNNGDVTITHTAGALSLSSGDKLGVGASAPVSTVDVRDSIAFSTDTSLNQVQIRILGAATNGGDTADSIQGSIGFSTSGRSTATLAAIVSVLGGADRDVMELGFYTHPSATHTDPMVESMRLGSSLRPGANDLISLGTATVAWSDLFLAEGGVINWDNGDMTLTQAGNVLTLAGGEFNFGANTAYFTETDNGNSGTSKTIDWKLSNKQRITLTGNVTLTFTAPSGPASLMFRILTGTGSFTVTWPASVKWAGGVAPTITTTASRMDLISMYYDGTNYYGGYMQNYTP